MHSSKILPMRKIILAVASIATVSFPMTAISQDTQTQDVSKKSTEGGYTGFAIEDEDKVFQPVDKLTFTQCFYSPNRNSHKVVFLSDNIPSAKDRRVIITNVTDGEENIDSLSYSDLEYEEERISEELELQVETENDDRKLAVTVGQNRFKYEIVDVQEENGQELEVIRNTGYFSTTINKPPTYSFCENTIKIKKPPRQDFYHPTESLEDRARERF